MNNNFEIFKKEVSWFVKLSDEVELKDEKLDLSDEFMQTFPKLYELVSKANVLGVHLTRNGRTTHYKLLTWGKGNATCGWMCKFETTKARIDILNEHQLLLDNIGGISTTFHQLTYDSELLTNNQNFIFTKSECSRGFEEHEDYYKELCEEEECEEIETDYLLCFASGSNSNSTHYDLKTKEVYLFATDHTFDNVEPLDGQPFYTFYTIDNVTSFVDYAELIATQWLERFVYN